ncbi:MAG: hypothetical protein WCB51_06480 [Candidatus Dormiibacterota bacterium]
MARPLRTSPATAFGVCVAATEPAPPTISTYPPEAAADAAGKLFFITVGCDQVLTHLDTVHREVVLQLPHM